MVETLRIDGLGRPADSCEASGCTGGLIAHMSWPGVSLDEIFELLREHPLR